MSSKHSAGKGSRYRTVDPSKWDENWEKAFGKQKQKLKVKKKKDSKK